MSDDRIAYFRRMFDVYHPTIRVMGDELLDEIARLRAALDSSSALVEGYERDIENLRAARLRPETVETIRMAIDTMRQMSDTDEEDEAMADLDRCYPPEEE